MMKIVVLDRTSVGEDVSVEGMKRYGQVDFYNSTSNELVAERVADADIIVVNKNLINEASLKDASHVKLICEFATGYDNVDIGYCKSRSIRVVNVRRYSTAAVAQHTVALALSVLENLPYYDNYVKSGAYAAQERFSHFEKTYYELEGRTWGIVGMGTIGQKVARAAEALGCHVIFYSASGHSTCTEYERVEFDELLARSDVLSLHCPLSERTRHLMNAEAFAKMKRSAILINVARGPVVDGNALYQALVSGQIRGAGIDVFEKEPVDADEKLTTLKDAGLLQLTPHMAWASVEARTRCVTETCLNIEAFLEGRERNVIA